SGKSTLGRLIVGLLRPTAGHVRVAGVDPARRRPGSDGARVGLVFQNPNHQLLARSIRAELALGPAALGWGADAVRERVDAVATRLALAGVLDAHPYRVPVPVRKRVAIGAILAMCPDVIVLDEPTAGQDRADADSIAALIREEARRGAAVIVITHDLRFALEVAESGLVLHEGRALVHGPVRRVLADQATLDAAGLEAPPLAALALRLGLAVPAGAGAIEELEQTIRGRPDRSGPPGTRGRAGRVPGDHGMAGSGGAP
ncbi:MAG: ABC transporter ATP-binding protein, partial [Candidatus Limnocylindrales bacterium]